MGSMVNNKRRSYAKPSAQLGPNLKTDPQATPNGDRPFLTQIRRHVNSVVSAIFSANYGCTSAADSGNMLF